MAGHLHMPAGVLAAILGLVVLVLLPLGGCASEAPQSPDPGGGSTGGGGPGGDGGDPGTTLPGLPTQVSSILWSGVLELTGAGNSLAYGVCRHGFSVFRRDASDRWVEGAHVDGIIGTEPRAVLVPPYVYVADGRNGFLIYSVVDPDTPALASAIRSTNMGAVDLDVRNRTAYVVDPAFGVRVIDANDLRALKTVGQYQRPGARCIALAAGRAYLGTDDGALAILDPATRSPSPLGEYSLANGARVLDLAVRGAVVHAVVEGVGLITVNAAVPGLVQELSRIEAPSACRVTREGEVLYVVERADAGDAIQVISVAAPEAPVRLAIHHAPARSVTVAGSELLVAADEAGMHSLDVTDPLSPVPSSEWGGLTGLSRVESRARTIAAASDQGVAFVDATNRKAPVLSRMVPTVGPAPRLSLGEGLCLVADAGAEAEGDEALIVVSWSNGLGAASITTSTTLLAGLRDVALIADTAAVAMGPMGVATHDLSDPSAPVLHHAADLGSASADLLEAGRSGLLVVDRQGPALLSIPMAADGTLSVGRRIDLPTAPTDTQRVGDYLLLPAGDAGLMVVDVTDDLAPVLLGTTSLPAAAWGADMCSGAIYVACGTAGLRLVALDQPSTLRPYVYLDTPGSAKDVAIDSGLISIADGQALMLLDP